MRMIPEAAVGWWMEGDSGQASITIFYWQWAMITVEMMNTKTADNEGLMCHPVVY